MLDPWIIVTIVLGIVVIADTLLLVGVLRNIGSLEYRMRLAGFDDLGPKAEEIRKSGPPDGSRLPVIRGEPLQRAAGALELMDGPPRHTLLVFLSSSCPSCHRVVEPVQDLAAELAEHMRTVVVMKSDIESALRFLLAIVPATSVLRAGSSSPRARVVRSAKAVSTTRTAASGRIRTAPRNATPIRWAMAPAAADRARVRADGHRARTRISCEAGGPRLTGCGAVEISAYGAVWRR